jgi:hypothetical protein
MLGHAGVNILVINTHDFSDGFSRKDYGNRNREQLVPAVVGCANRKQKQGALVGLVAPQGSRTLKFCGVSRKKRIEMS